VIRCYTSHGTDATGGRFDEAPVSLRFQRYQFAHLAGNITRPCYRSGLQVSVPRNVGEFRLLVKTLARKLHRANGSVSEEDLVQIGELTLLEGLRDLQARGIRPRPSALKVLLEAAQSAMFHAIDYRLVQLELADGSCGDEQHVDGGGAERLTGEWVGASCNVTVLRSGISWEFVPGCHESWGMPLPLGSCQPRPTSSCAAPYHLPLAAISVPNP